MEKKDKPIMQPDDLFMMANKLLQSKKIIIRNSLIGMAFGVLVALGMVKTYTAEIVLAPELVDGAMGGNLSSLASLAGVNIGANTTDALYPELYPQMIESNTFIVGLLGIKVKTLDGQVSTDLYDYLKNYRRFSWWQYPGMLFRRALLAVVDMLGGSDKFKKSSDGIDPFYLSKDQDKIVELVRKQVVSATVNKKDQVITLSVSTQDPLVSATLADSVRVRLQESITEYRTRKARHDMMYYEKLMQEAKADYQKSQRAYASYADSHQGVVLASYKTVMDDLENEMSLAYTTYSQMVQQYNMAKAKVQERTPSFTVVQPSSVPLLASSMSKMVVIILWTLLACIATSCWVLVRTKIVEWKNKIRSVSRQ